MSFVVVDTNVAVVANSAGKPSPDLESPSLECIQACVDALLGVTREGHLVIDDAGLIFDEYARNLSFAGQPGTGDVFMKWVYERQWDATVCSRVSITPDNEREFAEFPDEPSLKSFDRDDRKFVAVSAAHDARPPIVQAVDHKWRKWSDALESCGITVEFLCAPKHSS